MTSRTPTLPADNPKMWRQLVARTHPDAGGNHDLFIWTHVLKDMVCSGKLGIESKPQCEPRPPYPPPDNKPRVPWPAGTDFEECTRTALLRGAASMPYGRVLSLLANCQPLNHLACEQERGASYKRLAAIAHVWGMSKTERVGWYRIAEDIPLSDRHAGHILSRLKRQEA